MALKDREAKFTVHYNGVHDVYAELAIQAIGKLAMHFPELKEMNNFQFSVDRHNNIYLTELSAEAKKLNRESLQKVTDIKLKQTEKKLAETDQFAHLVSNKPLPLRSPYEATLGACAELFLDGCIRVNREQELRALIDDALDRLDEDAFMRYTTELKELPDHVQMAEKSNLPSA